MRKAGLPLVATGCHWLPLVATGCHWLPLVATTLIVVITGHYYCSFNRRTARFFTDVVLAFFTFAAVFF
jgi:hypothetical protein